MAIAKQQRIVVRDKPVPGQLISEVAFFDEDGKPVDLGGGGGETLPPLATAGELQAGTETGARLVSPKLIHDEIARQVAAVAPQG